MLSSDWFATFAAQMLSIAPLAVLWMGVHLIQKGHRAEGQACLVVSTLVILMYGYIVLRGGGWVDLGLVIILPALISFPIYWSYRHKERSRVFIWIAIALWPGLIALVLSVDSASSDRPVGYCGLAAAALLSVLPMYLYRKYTLQPPAVDERQRTTGTRWVMISTIFGLTVGGAIVREAVGILAPGLRAAVEAFMIGLLAFSILGCAGWRFLWEITRERL